jgi:hypothetical protein
MHVPNGYNNVIDTPNGTWGSPIDYHGYSDTQLSSYGVPGRTREDQGYPHTQLSDNGVTGRTREDGGSSVREGGERSYNLHLTEEVIYLNICMLI